MHSNRFCQNERLLLCLSLTWLEITLFLFKTAQELVTGPPQHLQLTASHMNVVFICNYSHIYSRNTGRVVSAVFLKGKLSTNSFSYSKTASKFHFCLVLVEIDLEGQNHWPKQRYFISVSLCQLILLNKINFQFCPSTTWIFNFGP